MNIFLHYKKLLFCAQYSEIFLFEDTDVLFVLWFDILANNVLLYENTPMQYTEMNMVVKMNSFS